MARHHTPLTGRFAAPVLALVLAFALPLAGSAGAAAAPVHVTPAATVDDGFERAECPVDVPSEHADRVTCHVLVVPERRTEGADPERTLRLPVAVITSGSEDPASDPLVFPTLGGPGAGSLSALGYFLEYADWAGNRDIILIEQRGDLLAEPTLNCPELDIENFIVDGVLLDDDDERARRIEQLTACHARLVEEGIDPTAYTSAVSVADLADLRAALGYDTWNLYGVSYGSRLAMTAMRDRPEGIRSVIVDGPYPPNVNRYEVLPTTFMTALDALYTQCAADAVCHESYPDLDARLERVLDSAASTPLSIVVRNPVDGSPVRVNISDTDLVRGLSDALYDADAVRVVPFLVDELSRGNTAPILPLVQRNLDGIGSFTEGLGLSIECAEEVPFNDDARLAEALAADPILEHYALHEGFREDCAIWAVPTLSDVENQAVTSEIPTLIMNGGYDPVTPLAFGEAAAVGLSTRFLYSFPTMGHGSVWANWTDACPASIAEQFLREPATEPDSSCIAAMAPTDFLTTSDIYPTTAIYRFNSDVIQDANPVQIGIPSVTIAALIGTLIYALVYGIAWLIRRRGSAPPGAVLVAATAAGLNLVFAAGMGLVLLNTDPLILGFGIPPVARALVLAPLIAIAVTILLTVVVVRAWVTGDGTTLHRVLLSVSAAASIVFAVWLVVRGLLIF